MIITRTQSAQLLLPLLCLLLQDSAFGSEPVAFAPLASDSSPFVYANKCTTDRKGIEVCFSKEDVEFVDVIVNNPNSSDVYGTIKVQTLVNRWPDGEVFSDSNGNKNFDISTYEGYLQNRITDGIDYSTLDTPAKVARWAAPAVVQVYGDVCMLNQNGFIDWRFASSPRAGFFIAPNLILTEVHATANFEDKPDGGGFWLGGVTPSPYPPHDFDTCQNFAEVNFPGMPGITFEVGAGPIIQTFDGTWGAGSVVASDGNFAIIKLTKGSRNKNMFVADWQAWGLIEKKTSALQLALADTTREASVVALHHPEIARDAGGWHATTADIISNCEEDFYFGDTGGATDVYAVDFWSDSGSVGAPVLDLNGYVVGMIKTDYFDTPDKCYGNSHPGKNSLGVLSTFFADPNKSTVVLGSEDIRRFIETYDTQQASIANANIPVIRNNPNWPANGVTLATANYEVIDYGDSFTVSGFPKSELASPAFSTAKQGTVMYIGQSGCTNCSAGDITEDFSDTCICTGFAVSKNLIVVNDHCVTDMLPGNETTFKTFQGQIVNATLVNRSGLDVGEIYKPLLTYPEWNETEGSYRGDVALLRTDQEMNLEPIQFADSNLLVRREPLITVGHPALMLRSGPFVTSGGAFIGLNMDERSTLHYTLPASSGASGSGVFDLNGRLVGQIGYGGPGYSAAEETWLKSEFNKQALGIAPLDIVFDLQPRPFLIGPNVQIGLGAATSGASSNYIKALINYWAPGELPESTTELVNLSGKIETVIVGQGAEIAPVCAMVLASGKFMFSCVDAGDFSLDNLSRENDGTVVRQIYADGFFASVTPLTESGVETVTLERAFNCKSYNLPSNSDEVPASAGKMQTISGRVLLQATNTPLCALVLANGQHMFSCGDDKGAYSLKFPLDDKGQYKLQVYADGFAPAVQTFNEFDSPSDVRMARSSECESAPASVN